MHPVNINSSQSLRQEEGHAWPSSKMSGNRPAGALEIQGLRLKQEIIDGFDLPFSCISGAVSQCCLCEGLSQANDLQVLHTCDTPKS